MSSTGTLRTTGRRSGVFYGWWVLGALFVVMSTGSGLAFYAQGVFLDALVEEQGFSVGITGAGTGFFFVVSGIVGYFVGGLIGRFDVRIVMTVGSVVAAAGIALTGQIRHEWQMFVVFFVFGAGFACSGLVPATTIVTRWFSRRRSVALSIASTGLSVGGIAITPVVARMIDDRSLVDVAPTLAVAYLVGVVPVTWLLVRPDPDSMGLNPDGDVRAPGEGPARATGTAFADAVRTRYFRLLSAGFVLIMGAQVGAIQHVFKLTKDRVDVDTASLVVMVLAATSVVARLAGGVVAIRVSLTRLTTVLIAVQAVAILILGFADARWSILAGVIVLGSAMGNLLMLHPLLLADAFGVRDYARIYGLGSLLMVVGVGLGPFVVGVVRDLSDYSAAFVVIAALAMAGLAVFRAAGLPDQAPPSQDAAPDGPSTAVASEATADPAVPGTPAADRVVVEPARPER